jgi:hypothetical protein
MKKSTSRGWKFQDNKIKVASLGILFLILLPNLIFLLTSTKLWAGTPGCCQVSAECTNVLQEAFCDGGIFTAGEVCSCGESLCEGECVEPPPTREINVRVIAICAAPLAGEPHEGDPFKCLCFGGPLNGYNATMSPDGINCPRRTIGPFCFVTEDFMPLYWKETVRNQSGPTTVEPGGVVEARVRCPEGKMVLSCAGAVTVGDTNEPAANVVGYGFPTADGLACRYVARTDTAPPPPDPCADLAAIAECPCDYHQVPMITDCWGECTNCTNPPSFTPCSMALCDTSAFGGPDACSLSQDNTNPRNITIRATEICEAPPCYDPPNDPSYSCTVISPTTCGDVNATEIELSFDAFSTCLCRVAQYADELAQKGINITDTGPPFSCEPSP